jgi:Fe-S oxidoreductase
MTDAPAWRASSAKRLRARLRATGANTVVTACPFCSIVLKGAQASAGADTQFVDLMTFVKDRL